MSFLLCVIAIASEQSICFYLWTPFSIHKTQTAIHLKQIRSRHHIAKNTPTCSHLTESKNLSHLSPFSPPPTFHSLSCWYCSSQAVPSFPQTSPVLRDISVLILLLITIIFSWRKLNFKKDSHFPQTTQLLCGRANLSNLTPDSNTFKK